MSTITYFDAKVAAKPAAKRKGLFMRFIDHMIEIRTLRAMEELKRHSHLLPRELDQAGWKLTERSEESLPFVR
jgi:hypothetical protein